MNDRQMQPLFNADGTIADNYYNMPLDALGDEIIADAQSGSGFRKTMNLDDIENQWVIITGIEGPFRIPSQYQNAGPDGKVDVLVAEVVRNLNLDANQGTTEYIPLSQQLLYDYFSGPKVRLYFERGGELGAKFTCGRTKSGNRLWLFELCNPRDLPERMVNESVDQLSAPKRAK